MEEREYVTFSDNDVEMLNRRQTTASPHTAERAAVRVFHPMAMQPSPSRPSRDPTRLPASEIESREGSEGFEGMATRWLFHCMAFLLDWGEGAKPGIG